MPVGSLLTVFGFLTGRATTVSTGDILFLLGLGLYLVVLFAGTTATTKRNAIFQNLLEITLFTHVLTFNVQRSTCLMMEQANTSERHRNTVLVTGHDDMVVAN